LVSGKHRNPTFGYAESAELAKLSRKGQLSIPKRLLKALGVEGEAYFLAELAPEGGLLLRPAGVYPLEVYTEERLQELLAEDTLTEEERARLAALAR
jgi:bifunctional DNA-binding transcriptional regulator/antitoxin component of YhaV-PrlF toxin-antitoxin module